MTAEIFRPSRVVETPEPDDNTAQVCYLFILQLKWNAFTHKLLPQKKREKTKTKDFDK